MQAAFALMVVATAIAVRVVRPYRPYPSIDDFAYVTLAWASRDPSLFPRDAVLRGFVHHAPAWDLIVGAADSTIGEATGFWLLTMLLTLATITAVARLMRATGVSPLLLPLVAALGFCGPVIGFGRGAYDGALGDAFHVQWLALCALLWSYDAFVRDRMALAGVWLGVAVLSHPMVGIHGAIALTVGSLVAGGRRLPRLPLLAAIAAVVSLPVSIPIAASLVGHGGPAAGATAEILREGYIFRLPTHYLPELTPGSTWWYLGVMSLAGLAAVLVPRPDPQAGNVGPLAGLLAGQALLAVAAALLYGTWMPERGRYASGVPYLLDFSRSSGLILPLAAVLLVGALELRPRTRAAKIQTHELLWTGLLAVAATALLFFVTWRLPLAALVILALVGRAMAPEARPTGLLVAGFIVIAAAGIVRIRDETVLHAPLTTDEAGLYRWTATTPNAALFIVPPGMLAFRFYARRSVYVDFKLYPPSTPASTPEWRGRMELVALPDRLALASPGWAGAPQWDRTYANRNTPTRIASLLRETGADYFVWDRTGLDVPPYVPVNQDTSPQITVAYANDRFKVYELSRSRAR